jgi:hypothetical protein
MIPASDERPDKTNALQPATPEQLDLGPGQWMIGRGTLTELYTIGALARALNRKPVTLRKWEAAGQLPRSGWQDARVQGKGKRRLYTRAQIEAAVRIAAEEGILVETSRAVSKTRFRDRLIKAWKNLEIDGAGTLAEVDFRHVLLGQALCPFARWEPLSDAGGAKARPRACLRMLQALGWEVIEHSSLRM